MGGAAAGTKWIHHIKRLSATKVSAEVVEMGQSRVIDASLTLIRERAKLKVSACIHSPAHSLKFPSFLSLVLILLRLTPTGHGIPPPNPDIGGGSVRYALQQRPPPRTPNWRSGSASPTGGGRTDAPYRCAWAHANGRASFARAEPSQRRGSWLEWEF